jgi:hypothetical protein
MNPKQKKFFLIGGLVVLAAWFLPSYITYQRQLAYVRAQIAARQAKLAQQPLPASPAPAATTPANPSPTPSAPSLDSLLGVWQGAAPLANRGICNMKLELRAGAMPGQYAGFPVLLCMQTPAGGMRQTNPNALFAQMVPQAAVATGTPKESGIDFHVDRVISKGASDCEMTSLNVTPFGSDQIAAEWKESNCAGGQILLNRLRLR